MVFEKRHWRSNDARLRVVATLDDPAPRRAERRGVAMGSHGSAKRRKELARQEKQREKAAARLERKKKKQEGATTSQPGEDPDLAGIVPGPQPPVEP
jgi:hypothetical protein